MLEFQLFRIKVFPSQQRKLFEGERTRPQILREVIESLPSAELRAGLTWHLGNVTPVDDASLYFRIGRTSTSTLEIFDEEKGSFIDQEFETAPYTHVILDVEIELCAIAKKPRLSPTTGGIARRLIRLLNESERAVQLQAAFQIEDINDPEDFISYLKEAYSISKFWVFFTRPNAWDANEHFVKPAQKLLEAADGEKGKIELKGQNLKAETLEAVARSAAATGDDAGAWIKPRQRARQVRKRLRGNPVNIQQDAVAEPEERKSLLHRMRELYQTIRGQDNE
ncbi:MAG: hypothetical protein ABI728_03100 [Betaproteobacteria bacterium]